MFAATFTSDAPPPRFVRSPLRERGNKLPTPGIHILTRRRTDSRRDG